MTQPDHDRLPPHIRASIDRTMAYHDIRDPFTEHRAPRFHTLVTIGAMMLVAWLLVVALILLTRPIPVEPTPDPFPPSPATTAPRQPQPIQPPAATR